MLVYRYLRYTENIICQHNQDFSSGGREADQFLRRGGLTIFFHTFNMPMPKFFLGFYSYTAIQICLYNVINHVSLLVTLTYDLIVQLCTLNTCMNVVLIVL